MTEHSEPPPDEILPAECALGLLEGAERAAATGRRLADPAFAGAVEAWDLRLAGLAADTLPVTPPETLWPRIAARLAHETQGAAADSSLVVRLQRRLTAWRGATAAAAGIAACLLAALVWVRSTSSPPPLLTARLSASARGAAVFVAFYDPTRRAIVLTPAQVDAREGRSPELWLIPRGGKPLAVGVANFAGPVQLASTLRAEGLAAGALAVSVEPKGGSPTGQPTGPVIATGQLRHL